MKTKKRFVSGGHWKKKKTPQLYKSWRVKWKKGQVQKSTTQFEGVGKGQRKKQKKKEWVTRPKKTKANQGLKLPVHQLGGGWGIKPDF